MHESSSHLNWNEEQAELEQDRVRRELLQFKSALATQNDLLKVAQARITDLENALAHCAAVFRSQAERGRYPNELLPECPEYLGKQGFKWALDLVEKKPWLLLSPNADPLLTKTAAPDCITGHKRIT